MKPRAIFYAAVLLAVPGSLAFAQQGYEFEVYDTDLVRPGTTELELNVNFVPSGTKQMEEGVFPTHRMMRSSVEIATGITNWLEASVYTLAARRPDAGASYVGNRLRLTAAAPTSWGLPLDFGITQEVGYTRPGFAENRWTYEISPMIGKTWGPVELALNPAFERGLTGAEHPVEFEPKGSLEFRFGDDASVALQYFSTLGPTSGFDPRSEQKHQLFVAFETEISRRVELATSFGRGLTESSDRYVVAARIEYKID